MSSRIVRIFQTIVCSSLIFFLASCTQKQEVEPIEIPVVPKDKVVVYFIKAHSKKAKLEVVYKTLSKKEADKKLFYAISHLVKGPSEDEVHRKIGTEIPRGTRLLSYRNKKDKAILNLTDQFRSGGGSRTMIMRYKQLYYTVAANAGEKPVYILIEGKPFKRLGGEGLITDDPIYDGQK
ncbi:MAG: GerMN domain-containing protein [Candidatus Caenarcaniphilales bacterium]|nr:GerMN domain-containing protein [Candidatus Caenarcaniphilales bacterium]